MEKKGPWSMYLLIGLMLFGGCQNASILTPRRRSIAIDGLLILNNTGQAVQDVKLIVGNTNRVVTCSYIPAGGRFTTGFPLKTYQGNPVVTTWRNQSMREFTTPSTYAQPPEQIDFETTYRAVVILLSSGKAEIHLKAN